MAHDHALLESLESFGSAPWQGLVWRHMFNGHQPNHVNVLGARWNPSGIGAIYTALERETALAEGQHAVDVQPRPIRASRFLYELEVDVEEVVDLSLPGRLEQIGIRAAELTSDDFGPCQAVGGTASWLDSGGLVVPSARRNGDNLIIIVNSNHDYETTTLRKEEVLKRSGTISARPGVSFEGVSRCRVDQVRESSLAPRSEVLPPAKVGGRTSRELPSLLVAASCLKFTCFVRAGHEGRGIVAV